tara:strand:+ start:85 stop:246 length:162 start_codon:yes stop_codon:yes gene_type:complete
MYKDLLSWLIWFGLVILWNYKYPYASPLLDVIAAIILALVNLILLKLFKRKLW